MTYNAVCCKKIVIASKYILKNCMFERLTGRAIIQDVVIQ